MTTMLPVLCRACVHVDRSVPNIDRPPTWVPTRCAAYPNGIPEDILFAADHSEPRGDEVQGLVFDEADTDEAHDAFDLWEAFAVDDGQQF